MKKSKTMYRMLLTSVLFLIHYPGSAQGQFYNITDYGALSDGKTVNTKYIQKAIDDCAGKGGGTVIIPAGNFTTGTLYLKSFVTLHLEAGAILQGSKDTSDYPVTIPGLLHNPSYRKSLIYGEGLKFVSVTGHGIIDGNSEAFFPP